jgi:hypothetical protein
VSAATPQTSSTGAGGAAWLLSARVQVPIPRTDPPPPPLLQDYIRCEGVKRLSYSANQQSPITSGDRVDHLEAELAQARHGHGQAGMVSIIVGEAKER